jgi:hypothetical protein
VGVVVVVKQECAAGCCCRPEQTAQWDQGVLRRINQGGTEIKDGLESESQQDRRRRRYAWVEETREEASNMGVKQ